MKFTTIEYKDAIKAIEFIEKKIFPDKFIRSRSRLCVSIWTHEICLHYHYSADAIKILQADGVELTINGGMVGGLMDFPNLGKEFSETHNQIKITFS